MNISGVLGVLAIICALGSAYTGVRIANALRTRGISANPALIRWMIFKYMAEYRRVTLKETGRVGPLYRQCATVSALAAFFGIATILSIVL